MSASVHLLQRYFWLADTIYSAGRISRAEIDRRWAHSSYNDRQELAYGELNFHRHRNAIAELFGLEIVCDRHTDEYYLAGIGDAQQGGLRAWLINTFAMGNMANLAGDMQDRILFEKIPAGTQWLSTIVSAMKEKRKLEVTYQRFDRPEPHTFLLSPYCLKAFKQRWYLLGKPDDHPEESDPRVYALDRVQQIRMSDERSLVPRRFSAARFLEGYFGVDRRAEVETVRIRVLAETAHFLRSLPIHPSQQERREGEHSVFTYRVAPTYDFIQELRKHGPRLEVLEPQHLRDQFAADHRAALQLYGD